jgi:cytochrome c peroxidase
MKKIFVAVVGILLLFACININQDKFDKAAYATLENKVDSIVFTINKMEGVSDKNELKKILTNSRKIYKNIEPFIEYYYQGLICRINGPALPEIKTDDNIVNDASGFQVIEEIIYSDTVDLIELKKQNKILITDLLFIKKTIKNQ